MVRIALKHFEKTRIGSRAVIVQDEKILLTHEIVSGWWLIPGGGLEEGETPEECCVRETDEEKSWGVKPEWISFQEAIDMFSRHEAYAGESEEKRGSYYREYMALREYMKFITEYMKTITMEVKADAI